MEVEKYLTKEEQRQIIKDFRIPRWEELPDTPVYVDQVLTILDDTFHDLFEMTHTQSITKSMINNYVKGRIIDAPINRKYEKKTVIFLIVIALLKTTYTIEEIGKLVNFGKRFEMKGKSTYNRFCRAIEEAVDMVYNRDISVNNGGYMNKRYKYLMSNFALSFACKLYVQTDFLYDETFDKYNR